MLDAGLIKELWLAAISVRGGEAELEEPPWVSLSKGRGQGGRPGTVLS